MQNSTNKKTQTAPLRAVFLAALTAAMLAPASAEAGDQGWWMSLKGLFTHPGDTVVVVTKDVGKTFADTMGELFMNYVLPNHKTMGQLMLSLVLIGLALAWALIPTTNRARMVKLGPWAILALLIPTIVFSGWAIIEGTLPGWAPIIKVGIVVVVIVGAITMGWGFLKELALGGFSEYKRFKGYSEKIAAIDPTWTAALPGAIFVAAVVNSQLLNIPFSNIPRYASAIAGIVVLIRYFSGRYKGRIGGKSWKCPVCRHDNKGTDNFCANIVVGAQGAKQQCGTPNPSVTYRCTGTWEDKPCARKNSLAVARCPRCDTQNSHFRAPPTTPTTPPPPPPATGTPCTHCGQVVMPDERGCGNCGWPNPHYSVGGQPGAPGAPPSSEEEEDPYGGKYG